jgi:iron complex outermembrane receptor protein
MTANNTLLTRRHLAVAVALAGATLATAGQAQEQEEQEQPRGGYSLQLEEVVVTAQKREENFMTVPLTVNAFTAQDMVNTGAATIQDIDVFMPGVEIGSVETGSSTQVGITIRGVGSPGISSGQDPSIATFYDGAYMPRAATSIPFTDIARVEVLKGPQGTLFGRNATAGVINIVPNKPSQELEGYVKTRLGNQNLVRVEGMINAPVSDTLALRGNIFSNQRDGFTESVTGGGDFRDESFVAARGVALWTPSEDTEIQLAVDFEDRDEEPRMAIGLGKYAYQGSSDPFRSKDIHDVVGSDRRYDTQDNDEEETREMYGVSLKLEHSFNEEWSMFAIASYRDWETTNLEEEDGTNDPRRYLDTNNIEDSDIFYTEVRFDFVTDNFNMIVGGNYSKEDVFQRTDIGLLTDSYMQFVSLLLLPEIGIEPTPDTHAWDLFADAPDAFWLGVSDQAGLAVLPPSFAEQYFTETMDNSGDFTNWGVFVDGTYSVTDTVSITAGLRYSYDEKEYSWQTHDNSLDWPYAPARVAYDPAQTGAPESQWFDPFSLEDDWSKVTGRLVADWQFNDNAMTYLSYATGYKSGGFSGQSFNAYVAGSFEPEDMESIEWGLKGDFFDNTVRAEIAIFHQELDNRQEEKEAKDSPDDLTSSPRVISTDEETDGIEIIVTWNITDTLRIGGLTTYRETDKVTERYFNSAGDLAGGAENSESDTDYTLKLDWTPEVPVGYVLLHMNYVFDEDPGPDDDTVIYETGRWYYQDKKLLNARLAWTSDDDSIEVAIWGNNLLDEEYATNPGGRAASTLGVYHTNLADQLTYGIDLRYSF